MVSNPIFVYGSLRKNMPNNSKLESAIYDDKWRTTNQYYMIGLRSGAYPYVSLEQLHESVCPTNIYGELYYVSDTLLQSLDELEGHPKQYMRREVTITNNETYKMAYMYILESDELKKGIQTYFIKRFVPVNGGDWVKHIQHDVILK